jgi:hypothetical protein
MTMRSTIPLLLITGRLLAADPALPRTSANAPGFVPRDSGAAFPTCARPTVGAGAASVSSATAQPAPLPAGAVALDSTWYDLQDMGSLGTRIVVAADGRVYVTWQDDFCELDPNGCPPNLNLPQPHPFRGMAYAYRDALGVWQHHGKVQDPSVRNCCVTELFGGFGGLDVTADGRAAVSQHMNEEGCDLRGNFYLQASAGGATWSDKLTPIVSPSYLFPQVIALPNGSFDVLAEIPRGGSYDETERFAVSHFASGSTPFVCPTGWQGGAWTTVISPALFRDGRGAFPSIARGSDGRAGIAVTDFGGNVFLIQSSDATFQPATNTVRNLTGYTDAAVTATDSTSDQYRAYVHCHVAYRDTTPHVVWSELQARRSGPSVVFFDHRSRIRHWDSVGGVSTAYQVPAGVADRYDDVDQGLTGPLPGFNTLSVDWPQIGFSPDGSETYVAWLRFTDGEVDATANMGLPGIVSGVGFGDIALAVRSAGGPWSAPQNLTRTPTTDERFFSLASRHPGGRAHLLFQASATDQAGVAVIGDRGASPGNLLRRIAYLERPILGSVVAVAPGERAHGPAALAAAPNPARTAVRFSLAAGEGGVIGIFAVDGRRIARLPLLAGSPARWNGRDEQGRAVPDGLYLARLEGREGASTKFLMLR